jgi:hypothetical protein
MFTNIGLVEHVKRALRERWGYLWGGIGETLTPSVLESKRRQYPDNINKYLDFIKEHWMGKHVADCVNLIKSYLWWNSDLDEPIYSKKYDFYNNTWISADGMFEVATEKGTIDTIPEIEGICVYKKGHIGVYLTKNIVIESKGTLYGVVETPLNGEGATKWSHWLKCPFIEYIERDDGMFNDIKGHYAEKYIKAIEKTGLMVGDGKGKFNPDSLITRAQLAVVLSKLLHLPIEE